MVSQVRILAQRPLCNSHSKHTSKRTSGRTSCQMVPFTVLWIPNLVFGYSIHGERESVLEIQRSSEFDAWEMDSLSKREKPIH